MVLVGEFVLQIGKEGWCAATVEGQGGIRRVFRRARSDRGGDPGEEVDQSLEEGRVGRGRLGGCIEGFEQGWPGEFCCVQAEEGADGVGTEDVGAVAAEHGVASVRNELVQLVAEGGGWCIHTSAGWLRDLLVSMLRKAW